MMCKMGSIYMYLTLTLVIPLFYIKGVSVNSIAGRTGYVVRREKRERPETDVSRWCGLPGRDGRDGRDGVQGPYGPPGQKGEPGATGRIEKIEKMLESLDMKVSAVLQNPIRSDESFGQSVSDSSRLSQESTTTKSTQREVTDEPREGKPRHQPPGGAVYTRWGRNSCPGDAEKLYHGVVVGSHYKHNGSGANYLCLPLHPHWNKTVAGHQSGSYIYGTEFEISESNTGFRRQNAGGKLQHNHDAQCSVCHVPGRLSHVMIPARLECPFGWTLEYIGFLMSAHHSHKRSEYLCIDQDPDVHPGTSLDQNGALFYITEIVCGSLPCPPFAEGFEVTYVVCTK